MTDSALSLTSELSLLYCRSKIGYVLRLGNFLVLDM